MLITHGTYYTNRLSFGVPLEDIFPAEDIHPGLKNLLLESYKNITKSSCTVEEILSQSRFQGSLQECLKLKDRLIICKKFEGLKISLGAPLWVIRHFLGLLPTPLFPQYSEGKTFIWLDISKDCKTSLGYYVTRGRYNPELPKRIAGELMRLPKSNLLLITTLFDFLRMLAVLPGGEPRINKRAIFSIVKYFSSSLFLRPFRPGSDTEKDKQYHPLLLYLILKWLEIRKICIKPKENSFPLPLETIYPGYSNQLTPGFPLYLFKCSKNNTTQTATILENKSEEDNALIRIVPPSYDDFSFLKDIACQTENTVITEDQKPIAFKKQTIFIRKSCCCTYSTNYETHNKPMENKFEEVATQTDDSLSQNISDCESVRSKTDYGCKLSYSNTKRYGWKFKENFNNNNSERSNLISSEFMERENVAHHNDVKTYDLIKKNEKQSANKGLKENISKMGWNLVTQSENSIRYSRQYSMNYDSLKESCKALNEELKEKMKELKIREKYDEETDNNDEHDNANVPLHPTTTNSKLHLSTNCDENKKSTTKVVKIRSKLDFLKIFNSKKAKKSFSCDQIQSGVKYEKMGSTNSLL